MTDEGLFEVYTGTDDINQTTTILKIDDKATNSFWANGKDGRVSGCNMINGTDAATYPPHLKPKGWIDVYSTDICRSARLHYEKKVVFRGITAYRFATGPDFLNEIGPEHGTECFCTKNILNVPSRSDGCLLKGAMDLTPCQGISIIGAVNLLHIHPSDH